MDLECECADVICAYVVSPYITVPSRKRPMFPAFLFLFVPSFLLLLFLRYPSIPPSPYSLHFLLLSFLSSSPFPLISFSSIFLPFLRSTQFLHPPVPVLPSPPFLSPSFVPLPFLLLPSPYLLPLHSPPLPSLPFHCSPLSCPLTSSPPLPCPAPPPSPLF
jgi:hypothetical protein